MPAGTNLEAIWDQDRCQDHFRCRTTLDDAHTFMLFCRLLIFFQNQPFRKTLSGIPRVSNSLDQDQARRVDGPDLSPNCLQRLTADERL